MDLSSHSGWQVSSVSNEGLQSVLKVNPCISCRLSLIFSVRQLLTKLNWEHFLQMLKSKFYKTMIEVMEYFQRYITINRILTSTLNVNYSRVWQSGLAFSDTTDFDNPLMVLMGKTANVSMEISSIP